MKKITIFHLNGCPYCAQAKKAIAELQQEKPAFQELELDWIEENENSALANQYDYFYVPSLFFDKEKQYEATPGESFDQCKAKIEKVFEAAL